MKLISCKVCETVYEKENYNPFICPKCGNTITYRDKNSLEKSFILLISAFLFYIPSMLYPIMSLTKLGVENRKTVFQGVVYFWQHHDFLVSSIIFVASVAIPLIKILGLFIIFISLHIHLKLKNKTKLFIFKFIKIIGKYSMIDIYVTAILAVIAQLGEIFTIRGDIAITSFGLMVLFTSLSAHQFDTRIIWDGKNENTKTN